MRTYERTHPWINFRVDLRQAPVNLWMLVGEAISKCEHLAGVPLRPETAKRLHLLYLAKGALATTAIEGNTLTEEEAIKRVEGKLDLPASKEYLGHEIDNIVKACNAILAEIQEGKSIEISSARIQAFNRQVLEGLPLREEVSPGTIRTYAVGVAGYRGAPAEDCEFLLARLCEWLTGPEWSAQPDTPLATAILKAVVAHLYLAWIHPFGDGNGRTARLLEFQVLIDAGVPTPAAHLLSNHYNQTRAEYYRQLDRASQSGGDVIPFLGYALQGFVDGLRAQIEQIRVQQWDVSWQNYVHDVFLGKTSQGDLRRRQLLLDLSSKTEGVSRADLPRVSPEVASLYARKTAKTLSRDINALIGMGLMDWREGEGYRAKKETILAFLPLRRRVPVPK
jgi:Fic family protein